MNLNSLMLIPFLLIFIGIPVVAAIGTKKSIPLALTEALEEGRVAANDVLLFVADLEAGEPGTDLDANSGLDFFDLLRFLEITGSACP